MDPFVLRLVQRLHDPDRPLSRNRHFHTFDTPEGRTALRLSRRLRSLARDILACREEGQRPQVRRHEDEQRIELQFQRVAGRRVSLLGAAEFALLNELPGVAEALRDER